MTHFPANELLAAWNVGRALHEHARFELHGDCRQDERNGALNAVRSSNFVQAGILFDFAMVVVRFPRCTERWQVF